MNDNRYAIQFEKLFGYGTFDPGSFATGNDNRVFDRVQ
jgi:hypothetical protein